MTTELAAAGSVISLASTLGVFRWLHTRSVKQGETLAENTARINAHDREFADMKKAVDETNANVRMLVDHMMNGKH